MKTAFSLIFITLLFMGCSKKQNREDGPLIKGKLVRNLCVDPLVQILDSAYFSTGENWLDTSTSDIGVLHDHIFTVDNPCDYSSRPLQVGDEFYFRITNESIDNCAVCAMFAPSPATRHKIRVDNP